MQEFVTREIFKVKRLKLGFSVLNICSTMYTTLQTIAINFTVHISFLFWWVKNRLLNKKYINDIIRL